jgi:CHAT domain-containing protein
MLGVLCLMHFGLRAANQAQQSRPVANSSINAIAEGKKEEAEGHLGRALLAFQRAERIAREARNLHTQAFALVSIGVCQIGLFQYRAAVAALETGARLADQANDKTLAGIAAIDLAAVYSLLANFALAETKQQDAIHFLSGSSRQDALVQAWLGLAQMQMRRGKISEGKQSSDRAIAIARAAKLLSLEAFAWDIRGGSLLLTGEFAEAEQSLNRAYAIQMKLHDPELSFTLEHRAELELKKHQYQLALEDLDQAFATADLSFKRSPPYYPLHIRGQILLGLGRQSDALVEFRRAVNAANSWRRAAMPGDANSTETVEYLHDIYRDYAHLAAECALARGGDTELSRQAFEALAENRAASLREQLALALSRDSRLPPRYFELLSQLQTTQAHVTLGENTARYEAQLRQIRLELSDLENQIGLTEENSSRGKEKNSLQNSLRDIQLRLGKNSVLLSFSLGAARSFLWAITGDAVNLYALPAETEIADQAKAFANSARHGRNAAPAALSLSQSLFRDLKPAVWQKREWLITADGALLNGIPFSALPDLVSPDRNQPLIANHTIRSLPSELLLLSANTAKPEQRFVGIADPIYNLADSRRARTVTLTRAADAPAIALGRLVGSDREIRAAAKQSGMADVQLLVGHEATGATLQNALTKAPELLHFAVHVVSPEGQPEEAALALSLTGENMPELLTREAIASYRVPGSLVVLSGCSSDQGRAVPSAGLIGLSRAWLLAGAAAVVVSAWPTVDDSGQFFSVFYNRLQIIKSGSLSSRAAAALQQAQLQMQETNGYRSSPSFWAAYSIVSKE